MFANSLLSLTKAGLKIRRQEKLTNINLDINAGDYTGIYGQNGSGKTLLAGMIGGNYRLSEGSYISDENLKTAVVTSEEQRIMLEKDRHDDDSEYMEGRVDPGRSVLKILKGSADDKLTITEIRKLVELFDMNHILDRGIRFLSTGEFRKMLIVKAMLTKPDILVLDDPYTGLDIETREKLHSLIGVMRENVKALVIISGRAKDLSECSRLFLIESRSLSELGSPDEITDKLSQSKRVLTPQLNLNLRNNSDKSNNDADASAELIRMESVNLSYYEEKILNNISWSVRTGEHWQIAGPNGSGKSTLLSLITGDNPKAYGQDIWLFGRKRGSGETIWEIKQKIGYVSGTLQREHRISQSVLSVVVSGYFDSIGLYEKPDPVQLENALRLCADFGIRDLTEQPFSSLSEGMKRSVLILRALIKKPEVIILDEPCQGLDDINSEMVLDAANEIILREHSTLLYVSHDPDYRMENILRFMKLVSHPEGGYTAEIR